MYVQFMLGSNWWQPVCGVFTWYVRTSIRSIRIRTFSKIIEPFNLQLGKLTRGIPASHDHPLSHKNNNNFGMRTLNTPKCWKNQIPITQGPEARATCGDASFSQKLRRETPPCRDWRASR